MNLIEQSLQIPAGGVALDADVMVPGPARGVVLFAYGSGSSRRSPRNRYVARELQTSGLATVLADLLTPREEQLDARTGRLRFDIGLLAARVIALADWAVAYGPTAGLRAGHRGQPAAPGEPCGPGRRLVHHLRRRHRCRTGHGASTAVPSPSPDAATTRDSPRLVGIYVRRPTLAGLAERVMWPRRAG